MKVLIQYALLFAMARAAELALLFFPKRLEKPAAIISNNGNRGTGPLN